MKQHSIIFFTDNTTANEKLIHMLQVSYNLVICSYSSESWADVDFYSNKNIVFILDTMPEDKDAIWIISKLYEDGVFAETPVLFTDFETMYNFERQGFSSFAYDVLPVPFNYDVASRRIENITEIRQLKIQFTNLTQIHTKRILNQANKLKEQTNKMQAMNYELVELLVAAIESRDMESGQHIKRIRYFTKALTDAVMEMCPEYGLDKEKAEYIYYASSVHDIGKIAIPDAIMLKPGRLTPDEFEIMKTHTTRGAELLGMLDGISATNPYFKYCQDICYYHHERWDGKGYPCGLVGDETPISAQIVAIADCYDALTSHRPYKKALSHEDAVELILSGSCGKFSPNIINCFTSVIPEFAKIENELKNAEPEKANDAVYTSVASAHAAENADISTANACEKSILYAYDIVFEADVVNDYFSVSSGNWDKFFSHVPKNFTEFVSQCHKLCHPADSARFLSKVNIEAFTQLAKIGREKTRVEFRVIKDGVEYLAAGFIVFKLDNERNIIALDGAFNIYNDDEILTDIKRGFGVTDGLTGLLLPKHFERDVESFITRNPDSNNLMIFIDIDDMSLCNSIFGYEYGNALIKEFASKIRDISGYHKIICKEASDKFAVFVTGFKKYADMALFIENLHNTLRKPYHTATESGEFTVTLGISRYPQDGNTCKNLVAAAEYASKSCKVNGKSSFAFYNNGMVHLASITEDIKSSNDDNDYVPKFVPIVNAVTNELVCYDYIPFSSMDDSIAVTTEVYYELNKNAASRKNLSSLSIKSLLYMMMGIKKQGKTPPPVSVYTMFMPDDMPSFLQELELFAEENDCKGIDLCIILPQDFLEGISIRKLKSMADIIKKLGFSLGLYLIGTRYIHNMCYSEDIFSRYIVTSDFVEHTISTGATDNNIKYAAMTLNNLHRYVKDVTIPFKLTDFEKEMMINGGANKFSCAEKAVFTVESLVDDFGRRGVLHEHKTENVQPVTEIEPILLYHDVTKTSCVLFTYYIAEKRLGVSSNAAKVFGEDIYNNLFENGSTSNKSVHPDDEEIIRNAMAKARTSLEPVTFIVRLALDGMYRKFVFTIFFIVDENGTPLRIQCSASQLFE